jgi:hypothetical protein
MRGRATFAQVAALHLLAFQLGITLIMVWCPRSTVELQRADALSKPCDPTDWRLAASIVRSLVRARAGSYAALWPPDVDLFASAREHQCPVYLSAVWDSHCFAADAMLLHWSHLVGVTRGSYSGTLMLCQPVCFAFPPFGMLVSVLQKIAADRATVWLVTPLRLPALPARLLRALPVCCGFKLTAPWDRLMQPASAVPLHVRSGGWRTALWMCLIEFA